ncbi:MAG: divergent polysaccharide deacetylase family protein [Candidatus Aminicenantes bacterium]|jgi:polysaccharide deacetylase 2 family uncharacterized protein YibQ
MRGSKSQKTDSLEKLSRGVPIILIGLAIFSILGLDYIQSRRGQHAFIFASSDRKGETLAEADRAREAKKAEEDARKVEKETDISMTLLQSITDLGIPDESVNVFTDEEGVYHLWVDIPIDKYRRLESFFFETLRKFDLEITKTEEEQTDEKKYYLWQAQDRNERRFTLLFSCAKERIVSVHKPSPRPGANKVALIVDDMGYSLEAINKLCTIGRPLTIAIIPYSPLASEIATISRQHDLEVILHLPLEAINNENDRSKGMITADMSEAEIIAILEKNLDQVPYIQGVNNHMGSKITANSKLMNIILERLKTRGLFFIDSRTTSNSVAYNIAQTLNIPSAYRHVFLDGEPNENYIKRQLIELFRRAQKNGFALGICHPTKETLKVLKENFQLVDEYGLEPVFASQIVQTP